MIKTSFQLFLVKKTSSTLHSCIDFIKVKFIILCVLLAYPHFCKSSYKPGTLFSSPALLENRDVGHSCIDFIKVNFIILCVLLAYPHLCNSSYKPGTGFACMSSCINGAINELIAWTHRFFMEFRLY